MSLYIVSYDLHKQRDYQPLWDGLRSVGSKKLLESFWLLNTSSTAAQVRDWLKGLVDSDDSVAVVEIKSGSYWACLKANTEGAAWLKQNVSA